MGRRIEGCEEVIKWERIVKEKLKRTEEEEWLVKKRKGRLK
jgi:hypothetical protein